MSNVQILILGKTTFEREYKGNYEILSCLDTSLTEFQSNTIVANGEIDDRFPFSRNPNLA